MKNSFCLILLLLHSSLVFSNDKIVGGDPVDPSKEEITHIVNFAGGCAGSIIAAKWILTAAHCAPIFSKFVTAGSHDLKSKDRFKLEIAKGHLHPGYREANNDFDIALIELKYPVHFENMGITPIALLTPEMERNGAILPGVVGTLTGWGAQKEGGKSSNVLMQVQVPIVSHEVANAPDAYKGKITQSMLPAGFDHGGKDSCQGDSGGPFTILGADGRPVLAGVISWGWGCARARQYGITSNVAQSYDWIMKTIGK